MNHHAASAYLSHIIEPGDTHVGQMLATLYDPAAVIAELWASTEEQDRKYKPRMILGTDSDKIKDWYHDALSRHRLAFIIPGDDAWPAGLNDLGHAAPPGLWVRGQVDAVATIGRIEAIAVVGARAGTSYGEHVAMDLASDLAGLGLPTVSGAAYGIDAAVHRGSLAAGGITVAFLAAGVDRPYPAGHRDLIQRIVERGAVVSEVPPGSTPTKWRFLARNRLIAAASDATVVVEAGYRSGSLNTAGHAAGLRRPVGAYPGPITSAASAGSHRLIREGIARLVTSTTEVLEMIGQKRRELVR